MIVVKELSVFVHIIGAGLVLQLGFPALRQATAGLLALASSTRDGGGHGYTEKNARPALQPVQRIWFLLTCMACGCFIAILRVATPADNGFLLERWLQLMAWVSLELCYL